MVGGYKFWIQLDEIEHLFWSFWFISLIDTFVFHAHLMLLRPILTFSTLQTLTANSSIHLDVKAAHVHQHRKTETTTFWDNPQAEAWGLYPTNWPFFSLFNSNEILHTKYSLRNYEARSSLINNRSIIIDLGSSNYKTISVPN